MRLCKAVPDYRLYTATLYHRAIQADTLVHNYIEQQLIIGLYKAIPHSTLIYRYIGLHLTLGLHICLYYTIRIIMYTYYKTV